MYYACQAPNMPRLMGGCYVGKEKSKELKKEMMHYVLYTLSEEC